MRPLVLTGGPAVGKTTCGRLLAEEHTRAAFIDTDDVRQLVVRGDETLWDGPEGAAQIALGARNASHLARNFVAAGFVVTIADFVTPESLTAYHTELPDCFIVHLGISLDGARVRAATRKVWLTDSEFELLHQLVLTPPDVDLILDVDGLTKDEQIDLIRSAWQEASSDL